MQIGRITGLTEPHDWDATGDDTVAITADYQSTAVSDGMFVRDQLLAYPTPDEDVIPIILTSESRSSGFYRPLRTSILTEQLSRIRGHIFNYRMDLQRVAQFALPLVEVVQNGALLTNAQGAVAGDTQGFSATPAAALDYFDGSSPYVRSTSDGNLNCYGFGSGLGSVVYRFSLKPADFYIGAARIEQGTTLRPVVGRNLFQYDVANWRLSNGLVRVTPNAGGTGKFDVSHWKGAAWAAAKTYSLFDGVASTTAINTVSVLRNSPEECALRLTFTTGQRNALTVDLSLRRGDRMVRMYLVCAIPRAWKLQRDVVEAATALSYGALPVVTGAIRATAADADGNRYVLVSDGAATTNDLVNGSIRWTFTSLTGDFGIGSEIGGAGAVFPDDANSLAQQYLAAQTESQRVVAR